MVRSKSFGIRAIFHDVIISIPRAGKKVNKNETLFRMGVI